MNLSRLTLCLALASSTAGAASFAVKPSTSSVASRIGSSQDVAAFRRGGARAAAAAAAQADDDDKTSLSASTFNLIKACVGSGVLALPAGVAAFADSKQALLPASVILVSLGALSAYSFAMLGRLNAAGKTVSTSLGNLWENEIGESSSWLVTLSCLLTPLGAALAFSIMLGDMLSSLATTVGIKVISTYTWIHDADFSSDISSIKQHAPLAPKSNLPSTVNEWHLFICACRDSWPRDKLPFCPSPASSFGLCATSRALPPWRPFQWWQWPASPPRVCSCTSAWPACVTVISLVGSYPIFFKGVKNNYLELTAKGKEITEKMEKNTSRGIILLLTGLALVLKNAGFVVGFTGAIMGSAIIYIFPPMLHLASTARRIEAGVLEKTRGVKIERLISRAIIAIGAILGVLCGIVAVLDSFFPGVL